MSPANPTLVKVVAKRAFRAATTRSQARASAAPAPKAALDRGHHGLGGGPDAPDDVLGKVGALLGFLGRHAPHGGDVAARAEHGPAAGKDDGAYRFIGVSRLQRLGELEAQGMSMALRTSGRFNVTVRTAPSSPVSTLVIGR